MAADFMVRENPKDKFLRRFLTTDSIVSKRKWVELLKCCQFAFRPGGGLGGEPHAHDGSPKSLFRHLILVLREIPCLAVAYQRSVPLPVYERSYAVFVGLGNMPFNVHDGLSQKVWWI